MAPDEMVEHEVAGHGDAAARESFQDGKERRRRPNLL
jgi:hypothetical protein